MKIRAFFLCAFASAALPAVAFERPGVDLWSGRPATSPVDAREYVLDSVARTMAPEGQILSKTQTGAGEATLRAAISPAQIVYSDPVTGTVRGTAHYVGQAYLFGYPWRQYHFSDNTCDLVNKDANIRRVVQLPDGNFFTIDMKDANRDEGLRPSTHYVRPLWSTHDIPVITMRSTPAPRTDGTLFQINFPGGGGSRP